MRITAFLVSFPAAWTLFQHLASAVALPDLGDAELQHHREHHRITQVPARRKLTGPEAVLQYYEKYKMTPPDDVVNAVKAASKGKTVKGSDVPPDSGWIWPITVGGAEFHVVFDTGSTDMWLTSTLTPKSQRGDHSVYNPNHSGKRISKEFFKIQYGKGSAAGPVYADKVVAGKVTATSASVGAATTVAQSLVTAAADGIVGYSFSDSSTCHPKACLPFFDEAYDDGAFKNALFAVALRHNGPGTWDFGFIDSSLYDGDITYTEQQNDYYGFGEWGIEVQGFSTGIASNLSYTKYSFLGLVDTGTTLLLVDNKVLNAFYKPVKGATYDSSQGGVVFPCSSTSDLPNLNFEIDGQFRTMPGVYGLFDRINHTYCFGGVQSSNGIGQAILGDVFLKSQYVVFNPLENIVGFAHQKGAPR